jgi:hypothetical protein
MRKTSSTSRLALVTLLTALTTLTAPSFAQSDGYKLFADLPGGIGCSFPLRIEYRGESNFYKEFHDRNGNLVRVISAGSNIDYRFTNLATTAKLDVGGKGSMTKTTPNPDGTSTIEANGHNIIILYPTDFPAGPTTTLYEGRVVYTVDSSQNFVVKSTKGNKTDLCKELS